MDLGNEGLLSPEAVADPPVFARARAVAHFEDSPVRQLVHRLKYNDRMELAKPLGAWMARVGNNLLAEADLLIPVPLHRRRLAARRFNRRTLGASHRRPMRRPGRSFRPRAVKPTPSQVGLSRSQRALNLQGAFRVTEGMAARIEGRAVVLIDDVRPRGRPPTPLRAHFCEAARSASMSWFSRGRYKILFQAALVLRSAATLKLASVFALTSSSVTPSASSIRVMPPLLPLSMEKTAKSVITRSTTAVPVSGKVQ